MRGFFYWCMAASILWRAVRGSREAGRFLCPGSSNPVRFRRPHWNESAEIHIADIGAITMHHREMGPVARTLLYRLCPSSDLPACHPAVIGRGVA
jgi:hypothetical protein